MGDRLDLLIKNVLQDEAEKAPKPEKVYSAITDSLQSCKNGGAGSRKYPSFIGSFKRNLAVATSCAIVLLILVFSFSDSSRSFALEAINSIKTIFDTEKVDGKIKVVQKPSNEAFFYRRASDTTFLEDEDLTDLLGYKVKFPQTIEGDYKLQMRFLSVSLHKKVDYDTLEKLRNLMVEAINSDQKLKELKKYSPKRYVSGTYTNNNGSSVFISIDKKDGLDSLERIRKSNKEGNWTKFTEVKINGLKGYWIEYLCPVYPDGVMTRPPIEIREMQSLSWDSGNLTYTINTDYKTELPLKKALKIAEKFQKEQPEN